MALFSLLLVLAAERLRLVSEHIQFDAWFERYRGMMFNDNNLVGLNLLLALVLPAGLVMLLQYLLDGVLFGILHLGLWIVVGLVLFGLEPLRKTFRAFLRAARDDDLDAAYHYADLLDESEHIKVSDETQLGLAAGQLVAWLNYRFYAAVTLYFVALGPAAATLYCTVRAYHDHFANQGQPRQAIANLLKLLDWLPVRIVALGFALSGHFTKAMKVLTPKLLDPLVEPRWLITEVAIEAEDIPEKSDAPICIKPTLALLKLAKRNFILLLVLVSLLTIFGVLR